METSNSKFNFYTHNGWAGSNYDQNLTAKEIAVKIRSFLKKEFPAFKFSVRSKWGMQADTIYITIQSGPVPALMPNNLHSYESSISGFGRAYENRITSELLDVCGKIENFVNSYRYSDCDGMEDYFDVNFYCWMYIGDYNSPYQVIDVSPAKASAPAPYVEEKESQLLEDLEIVDYSEKAIAIFGNTKEIKEQLSNLGGKFNPSLKYNRN